MADIEAVLEQTPVLTAELNGLAGSGSGVDGATFTPAVSEDGTLSWTNDKGLENPEPVNIMGPAGSDYVLTDEDKAEIAGMVDAGEPKLPLSGGTMSGALIMENNVPIYAGTSDGNIVLLGMMNAGDVMGIGSTSYPLVIHGSSITLDNLKVVDAAGALANLGGISMKKLWGNASPDSDFNAQTLTLEGMNDYDVILIATNRIASSANHVPGYALVEKRFSGTYFYINIPSYDGGVYICERSVSVNFSAETVVFANATQNGTLNNTRVIPIAIYGIKGVRQ